MGVKKKSVEERKPINIFDHFVEERLSDKEYAAIGRVACESSELEWEIDMARALVSHLSFQVIATLSGPAMLGKKITVLSNLLDMKLKGSKRRHLPILKKMFSEMSDNNSERTVAVHGTWHSTRWSKEARAEIKIHPEAFKINLKDLSNRKISMAKTIELAQKIKVTRLYLHVYLREIFPRSFGGGRIKNKDTRVVFGLDKEAS